MKFRAFDKTTNKMYYSPNEHIYLNIDGTCVNFQNGEVLEVMFETGYPDIKGNLVYDGDFMKDDIGTIVKVRFGFGHWELDRMGGPYQYPSFHSRVSGFEVVGNTKQHKLEDFQ